MTDPDNRLLLKFLRLHSDAINLSEISRRARVSPAILQHVISGRRVLTDSTASRIRPVLDLIVEKYPKTGDK